MKNKRLIFSIFLVFIIVFGVSAISAQDVNDTVSSSNDDVVLGDSEQVTGTVSGDVDVVTENPWNTTGELSYDIPADAKTIKSADVYVNVYSGSAETNWGCNANISISTANGNENHSESLWIPEGTTDGTVYPVNDHTTKCYSDYMIHYDVTSLVQGLNGTNFKVTVDTFKMDNKTFDGRIKLIALVLAYDDGDNDEINYWINANQLWSKTNVTIPFNTIGKSGRLSTLTNVVLSSGDGTYRINNNFLIDAIEHKSGDYYQFNKWDVSSVIDKNNNTSLNVAYAGTGAYGSIKNVLSVLKIEDMSADVSLKTEYASTPSAFAGTNNTLTVTISTTKSGKYVVKLLADGDLVNETEIELSNGTNTLLLTDPTIRPVDETTVNGAENKKVNYTVEVVLQDRIINSTSISAVVVYNGYLGKDLAYPADDMQSLDPIIINGDIVVETKEAYLSGEGNLKKTDIWTINLGENATIVKSFVYVPYTWCDPSYANETLDMFDVIFNGEKVTPDYWYRDQSNLGGKSGRYGYGVFVYDVTSLVNKEGNNTLDLNKSAKYPGVYSSALVYMYNVTNSNYIKEVYINQGADILYNSYNDANRPVKSDSTFVVDSKLVSNATFYVFASNVQDKYTDLVFNGETTKNIFADGKSYVTSCYELDVTGKIKDSNSVSVIGASKNTFLTLNQIMVLTKNLDDVKISLATEYTNTAYAGTTNAITVTIDVVKSGNYTVKLLADGQVVAETEINLVEGTNKVVLTDLTIRPVDESTVNGKDNKKVNYTVQLSSDAKEIKNSTIIVPVLYDGYLNKKFAYPAGGMESFVNVTINGDIVIDVKDVSTYMTGADKLNRTDVWTINLGNDSTIVKSYIYVPYNWCDPKLTTEGMDMFNATFNGEKVTPIAWYRDQSNLGTYGQYGYGVLVYDVTALVNKAGNNSFFLSKAAKYPAVYPSVLIYMYNTTGSEVVKTVYISNGADLLADSYNVAERLVMADSTINVAVADSAELYVFAASAQSGEGNIIFNDKVYKNVWNGTSSTTDLYTLDVTNSVKDSNNILFVATGSTILALQQIIVTTKYIDIADVSLATEYANTAYAGTTNAITVTIDVVKSGNYTVKLLADGQVVAETEINLVEGTNKVVLTDLTIRPVDESTVNGKDNKKVNYTVQLSSDAKEIKNSTIIVPVLYDGYLNKKFAYPAGGMESFVNVTINGDIVIDVKDVSTYMTGADKLNRTDVWTINLGNDSTIVKSYIYVPYNWCDPKLTTEGMDMFNATFNGEKVTPIAWYRDQSNLGTYGQYGYGVLVYDVTALVNKAGNNSFFLSKAAKYPAVYPSVLIYMYNTTGSEVVKTVYISNGADLLADSYNVAERLVMADSTINVAVADSAELYVFAASAQSGEGTIIFNGDIYKNVWNGTSSTTDLYTLDVTSNVKDSNNISFVATGGTILALQQIMVVTKNAPAPVVKTETKITASSVTKVYNKNKNFVATLKDANGKAISSVKVTIKLNGNTYTKTTNSKGQVSLAIPNLVPKTYKVTVKFAGNDKYKASSLTTAKVKVKKATVKLTAKKKTFKAKKKTKKYTVTLKNNKGKAMKKVKLTLKVNKKTYKAKTNKKGKATFKITKLNKKGKFTAKITYKGNKYYNKLTKKVKITVKK